MPIVHFPEFEQFKAQGYKGTFVGGCVVRGEGSSFRRKAHAHCYDNDPHQGWICVRSTKRLYNLAEKASLLMWHEMAHIITKSGHGKKFYLWLRDHSIIRRDEERISQWAYLCRHYKDPVAAYNKIKGLKTGGVTVAKKAKAAKTNSTPATADKVAVDMGKIEIDPIMVVTGDAQVKKMGVAKAGGNWYKNHTTGVLYRITEDKAGKLTLAETIKPTKAQAENAKIAAAVAKKATVQAPSKQVEKATEKFRKEVLKGKKDKATPATCTRAALMQELKEKGVSYFRILNKEELQTVKDMYDHAVKMNVKEPTKIAGITEIIETAKKRWQKCPFFQKKEKKA
jgi:hypothetical protein